MHQRRIPRKDRAAVEYENKRDREKGVTSKKGATAIEGNAFHTAMFQILLYHFWEIALQWIFNMVHNTTSAKQKTRKMSEVQIKAKMKYIKKQKESTNCPDIDT